MPRRSMDAMSCDPGNGRTDVTEHLAMLTAWCGPGGPGLVLGLLLAGLAGSPLHCGPMCAPFVLGQTADRLAKIPAARLCELSRLKAALLAPYHAGRLTTYAALGAAAGSLGALPGIPAVAGVLLFIGGLVFLTQALRRLAPSTLRWLPRIDAAPAGFVRALGGATSGLRRGGIAGGYLLGLALGLLPCGFLYAALAVAGASGGAGAGALAMLAFGLGTVPSLVAVGLAGQAAGRVWRRGVGLAAPFVLLFNAALLAAAAAQAFARI
jgi:sulfite exporter TauE/SafE